MSRTQDYIGINGNGPMTPEGVARYQQAKRDEVARNGAAPLPTSYKPQGQRTRISFKADVWETLTLHDDDGELDTTGMYGDQYRYWLRDHKIMWLSPDVRKLVQDSGARGGDTIRIGKFESTHQHRRKITWKVERLDPAGEPYDHGAAAASDPDEIEYQRNERKTAERPIMYPTAEEREEREAMTANFRAKSYADMRAKDKPTVEEREKAITAKYEILSPTAEEREERAAMTANFNAFMDRTQAQAAAPARPQLVPIATAAAAIAAQIETPIDTQPAAEKPKTRKSPTTETPSPAATASGTIPETAKESATPKTNEASASQLSASIGNPVAMALEMAVTACAMAERHAAALGLPLRWTSEDVRCLAITILIGTQQQLRGRA